jgi:hypothetical protein
MPMAGYSASHQSNLFQCVRGVGAKVFGIVGEVEPILFDGFGRKSVEGSGVGNHTIMEQINNAFCDSLWYSSDSTK